MITKFWISNGLLQSFTQEATEIFPVDRLNRPLPVSVLAEQKEDQRLLWRPVIQERPVALTSHENQDSANPSLATLVDFAPAAFLAASLKSIIRPGIAIIAIPSLLPIALGE
jgi:hypothetical protein